MIVTLHDLAPASGESCATPQWRSFIPPNRPPPDWPVAEDHNGNTLAVWVDSVWPLAGSKLTLNFGDGPKCQGDRVDRANADLLRLCAGWRMWGPRALDKAGSIAGWFCRLRPIFALCSRANILASGLMRFPKILEQIPDVLAPSKYDDAIADLHRLYDAREELGFVLVDREGLKRLAAMRPDYAGAQTPYIPPRIWTYQALRLRECLDDFLAHRVQIDAYFAFCLEAYVTNYGSLEAAMNSDAVRGPFNAKSKRYRSCTYVGSFPEMAKRFGIFDLLGRWVEGHLSFGWTVQEFSSYLSLVSVAGLMYIGNFTLQRKEELNALRADCLQWENDPKLGRVPIICGETTKTAPDADARWVATPGVEVAIKALTAIAHLQMPCVQASPLARATSADIANPYLCTASQEPWATGPGTAYSVRTPLRGIGHYLQRFPKLLDQEQLRITEADLKTARQLTPQLPLDEFAVGLVWPLAWHQYRRTGAVNMSSSSLLSDSTLQQQLKHATLPQSLYYRRGYTGLRLNREVESSLIVAMYEAQARDIRLAMSDRFIPASPERKQKLIQLLSITDERKLINYAKKGTVSYRRHILGGCMKAGACEYGGVESIARCVGGDGNDPCSDALYDRDKEPLARAELGRIDEEMARLPKEGPRYRALVVERRGFENFLNVIHQ